MNRCTECERQGVVILTANPENEYGEFICVDCEANANERAWQRQQEGDPPTTDRERYVTAWDEHQKAHR